MIFTDCNIADLYISINFLLTKDIFEVNLFKPGTFIRSCIRCNEIGFDIESQDNKKTVTNNYANNEHWIYDVIEDEFRSKLIDELTLLYPKAESYADSTDEFLDILSKYKTSVFFRFNRVEDACNISYVGIVNMDDLNLKFYEGLGYLLKALKLEVWNS